MLKSICIKFVAFRIGKQCLDVIRMNISMKYNLLHVVCIAVGLLSAIPLHAQRLVPLTRATLDSIKNPELLDEGESILRFEKYIQSAGTLLETDAPVTIYYSFQNVSQQTVSIRQVRTFCRCTSAQYDTLSIKPGDTGRVALTYRPRNHVGTIDECAYVYTSLSDTQPIARLVLLGEVKEVMQWRHLTQAMGTLHLKQKELNVVVTESGSTFRIACANAGKESLRLSAEGLPPYASFRTEPRVLRPGMEGDLVIVIDAKALPHPLPSGFEFILQGIDTDTSERTLKVHFNQE